jgi:hypothetical protein
LFFIAGGSATALVISVNKINHNFNNNSMYMDWREDGYNYDSENNRVGYSGKPMRSSHGIGFIAKLVILCFLIYGGKSIFGTMPQKVAMGFDYLFQFLLAVIILIIAIKILRWLLQNRKRRLY